MNANLCFHGIGVCEREREPGEARYWVGREEFLRILDVLAGRAGVRLSFDDGNRSDAEVVLPALRERGLTATFFVLAGRLDDAASLDADAVRALRESGMTVGSHGWAHVPWYRLSPSEQRREFHDARAALQEVAGVPVDRAALPLGRYDRRALRGLREAGYRHVFTSDRFPARPGAWLQARYSVTASDTADTVHRLLERRPGRRELRNAAASMVKRLR